MALEAYISPDNFEDFNLKPYDLVYIFINKFPNVYFVADLFELD